MYVLTATDGGEVTRMNDKDVDGYIYKSNPFGVDEEIVQLVGRVTDRGLLEDIGPAFFIRMDDGEVRVATANTLNPWFAV